MPSEFATKSLLKVDMKNEDPSMHYDILGKIATGAFAKVFEVIRKSDNKVCALKFCDPKS